MNYIKTLALGILLTVSLTGFSQKASKYTEINFRVEGKCEMCETRIENALDIKGIKIADWDLSTKNCRVVYKTELFKETEIHQLLANIGHTTEKVKTSQEAYDGLHGCCKY
ncbi:MAG: cation transporter [Flavobacteriales bacterium]|nr:cation transporter [Flavobacteriales bacterium]